MLILKLFHFRQLNGQQPADSPGGVVFRKLGPTTQRRRQGLGRTGVGKAHFILKHLRKHVNSNCEICSVNFRASSRSPVAKL